ncbi:MAG: hypothetical protein RLP44_09655 [Aggregatilineales bacterium]
MTEPFNEADIPDSAHTYEKRSVMKTTVEQMIAFHNAPRAFATLTPPPIFIQVIRDDRTSLQDGEVEFNMWFGPLPIRWIANHEEITAEHGFADRQIKGPLAFWYHRHIFEATPDGVALIDRISIMHKPGIQGILTRLFFDGIPLRILFFYRHLRTRMGVNKF